MRIDLDDLPVDTSLLHHLVRDMAAVVENRDSDVARVRESAPTVKTSAEEPPPETRPRRKPLPDHLSREDVRLDVDSQARACCGGALHAIGESVSEMLDWVPS